MKRRLINFLTALSLLLCVALCVLWVRGHRDLELVQVKYNRWPRADNAYGYFFEVAWYSGWLGFRFDRQRFSPAYFRNYPDVAAQFPTYYRPGLGWDFVGAPVTREMNGPSHGWRARHYADAPAPGHRSDRWFLTVPNWLPVALLLVPPALWLNRFRKLRRAKRAGLCPSCGYNLTGNVSGVCPECGRDLSPGKSTTPAPGAGR